MESSKARYAASLPWQTVILEGIARGAALEKTLDALTVMIESEAEGFICGVCLLSSKENAIAGHFAPRLPESYRQAMIGQSLSDAGASPIAAAACTAEPVVVHDLESDSRWAGTSWREQILAQGFRFCQASPIRGSDRRVLGVLVLYAVTPPEIASHAFSETAENLACIAIEKHRDESALRESEERLRLVMTGADLGTWDWNLTTGELIWSERCKEMFGYAPQTVMNYELFLNALHPDDRARADQAVRDALEGRAAYDIEFRTVWKDGTVRWINSIGSGFGEEGKSAPLFMRGIALDITERKEAEFQVAESAARFQFLAESLPEKIFTTNAKGDTDYLNQQWAEYTGLPVAEVMRLGWREFVHPEDIEEKMTRWSHAMEKGTPFEFEHRFRRADGEFRWHLSRAHPMRRADGTIGMWVGSNIDVDDLKRAQFELRESESRSRIAMEAARLGSWDWNMGGRVTWSPEHNRMFGLDPDIAEGDFQTALAHIHPEDRPQVERALQRALSERVDYEAEFRTIDDKGAQRWVAAHGRAYYHEQNGQPVRMIGVVRDVTERRNFEEQLRTKQEELRSALASAELARSEAESANRAKDQFLAVLSHELRTPLTPVLMAVAFLGKDKKLPQHVQDAMQMIQRNIMLEARLIEDLLDLTRIARDKMELHTAPMDLHLAIRRALEVCGSEISSKKHRVHVDLSARYSQVVGDFDRLQQVFWNLIKNAAKFTPEGGQIIIVSRNDGQKIVVEVIDSGMGIPPEILPKIFNPFEQGSKDFIRQYGGLGLGLAISMATIEAHHGTLTARSGGQNQGATFVVELDTDKPLT